MSKQHIGDVIGEEYKRWDIGNLILLASGTGSGKTYFIKKVLNTYAKETGASILYLTNRDNLKQQIKNDIGDKSKITVLNYQKIEEYILHDVRFTNYDYVVMDEAQYFFCDAGFSRKTDIFFKRMLADDKIVKVMMSATPLTLLSYLAEKDIKLDYIYKLNTDYNYLDKIVSFGDYETVDSIIESIPKDEQIMYFTSAKRGYETSLKYDGAFICSKHNDKYKSYIDEDELTNIIENGKFNNHLLCCTTALDNGVNIKEGTPVRHIIIEIFDRDIFIQCLGRKRVEYGEKVNLYFNAYKNKKRINGFKKKVTNTLDRANYLIENGEESYIYKKYKSNDFFDTKIIDEHWDKVEKKSVKSVNECMYTKFNVDLIVYNSILNKRYPVSYKEIIACALSIKTEEIEDRETKIKILSIEESFESIVGIKLFKEERTELIEYIGLVDARGRLQKSISQLNEYLKSNSIQYIIISKKIKIEKKLITVWIVDKLILEK